ncbi:hypothetical protein FACS1894132_02050 [Clostridia bacterium]|nr:hypothetical protein FACS1894132_02050 [Clostridia bacterium]
MPTIFNFMGYKFYFWSLEGNEPVHIHMAKSFTPNGTKFWLLSNGEVVLANDKTRISDKELIKAKKFLKDNYNFNIARMAKPIIFY